MNKNCKDHLFSEDFFGGLVSFFLLLVAALCLLDITAFLSVECRNLLFTVSCFFSQPLGPITAALLAPILASSNKASAANLRNEIGSIYRSHTYTMTYFCSFEG